MRWCLANVMTCINHVVMYRTVNLTGRPHCIRLDEGAQECMYKRRLSNPFNGENRFQDLKRYKMPFMIN